MGNRIAKHVWKDETWERSTYYLLDAQGNQVSIYEHRVLINTALFNLEENNIYGTSRVGSKHSNLNVLNTSITQNYVHQLGNKNYEFTNHLGNVLTVFTDKKIPQGEDNNGKVDGYEIGIFSTADYSPFGVQLDGRSMRSEGYRYGFNGQEKTDELSGSGNHTTATFWEYSSRIGRRWNTDPVVKEYISPYACFGNNPIFYADPNGDDWVGCNSNGGDAGNLEWRDDITTEEQAKEMGFDIYHKVGTVIQGRLNKSDDFQGVYLGKGFAHYSKEMKDPESGVSSIPEASSGLSDLLKSPILPSPGYKISNPEALKRAWMNDPDPFIGIMNKFAMGAALAPAAIMALPSIYQYGGGALKYGYEGMKLYHNSIGVNGGYVNAGLNYLNQSYTTGELGMNGKSISGLIMAGSLPFNASLFGQIAVGASDPWGSINFSSSKGLYLDGFVSGNQTIQKTMALSTMGLFGPLYQQVPLFNSKGINFLIEQGAMAPMQKALQNVEE
jgi:RHS repeat-associated protein